ncbi:AGAP007512-PA-like protein [Anopheles sinensis]|uniref:AGAP007512-PA-like protein n=1 Tax=Anopheles sinensis TaxID=74873 RepID=A0A084WND9_ANOSI|nr:AGAP007512-PA-like protein [Anopheles sinensis]
MNSVFSAFKSSSSSSASSSTAANGSANGGGGGGTNTTGTGGKHDTSNGTTVLANGISGGPKSASKLLLNIKTHRPAVADHPPNSSYEKLRHIREISCTNRNNSLVGTLDRTSTPTEESPSVATTPVQSPTTLDEKVVLMANGIVTSPSSMMMNGGGIGGAAGPRTAGGNSATGLDQVDHHYLPAHNHLPLHHVTSTQLPSTKSNASSVDGAFSSAKLQAKADATTGDSNSSSSRSSSSCSTSRATTTMPNGHCSDSLPPKWNHTPDHGPAVAAAGAVTVPLAIKPPSGATVTSTALPSAANGPSSSTSSSSSSSGTSASNGTATMPPRFHKPRLSLSSSSGLSSANMPAVHGRTGPNIGNGSSSGMPPPKTRLSTHQRNLSLDFR